MYREKQDIKKNDHNTVYDGCIYGERRGGEGAKTTVRLHI